MKITGGEQVTRPYILMTPSYGSPRTKGHTPKPVVEFLKTNYEHMVGVVATGNLAFGEDYCASAYSISARFQVPIIWKVDLRGQATDIAEIDRRITADWDEFCRMRFA